MSQTTLFLLSFPNWWVSVLYSVVHLQKFCCATLQFTVLNRELYQKPDFMVIQLIITPFISYNCKNCAVNKYQAQW